MRKYLLLGILTTGSLLSFSQTITSTQDGAWDNIATWAGGVVPTSVNTTAIVINHAVNVPNGFSVTVDEVSVSINATLTIDTGGTLIVAAGAGTDLTVFNDGEDYGYLAVNGTVIGNDLATIAGTDQANTNFNGGSIYRHLYTTTEGSIPIANWNVASTVQIEGYTGPISATAGGNWSQAFHNFTFNSSGLGINVVDFNGFLISVLNDLTITSTGGPTVGRPRFSTSQNPTIAIGRDLIISGTSRATFNSTGTAMTMNVGRDFILSSTNTNAVVTNTTGNTTINIARDFIMNGAGSLLSLASGVAAGNGTLNITGNFALTAGTITESSSQTGVGNINFVTAAVHTFTNSGTITNQINFSVATLSTLDLGTSVITGSGSFTLNGILRLGSTDSNGALQASTTAGNIRTPILTRTYAPNSTIVYNGVAAQFIGDGFPPSGSVNLTINNSFGVTLSTSLDIASLSVLTLTSGNIIIGTQTLIINGTVSGAGGITGGPTSNLTIGGTGNFGILTFSGLAQLFNFTLNRTSSGLVTLGGSLAILGTFTHTAGTLAVGSNSFTVSGAWGPSTPDNLAVTGSSTILVDGTGSLPSDVGFGTSTILGTLTFNRASSTFATTSSITINNLNLISGTFSNGTGIAIGTGGIITRTGGSMFTNPSNTINSYNVVYTSGTVTTGPELPSNSTALNNLSKTGSGTLTLGSNITVNGIFTLSSGLFNAGSNSIDLKGNFVSNAGSTLTSSPITFSGTTSISGSSVPTFGALTITGSLTPASSFQINGNLTNNGTLNSGSGTVTFGGTTTIGGSNTSSFNNVVINGSLIAPSSSMNVAGTWTNNGTFNNNSGTVVFNGTSSISGGITNFGGLTIAAASTLTSPATLNVAGNFSNNGTFAAGSGTLVLNGSSTQSILGSSLTTFNNISVTNSAGPPAVQIESNQNLRGVLTLAANSVLDADGSSNTSVLTLLSTKDNLTEDASIATLPNGAIVNGNVTVQRFMAIEGANSGRIYRYVSSPVSGAAVSQIQAFIPVIGSFTGADASSTGFQSMFSYNESDITGNFDTGYINFPAAANTETFAPGVGYAIFVQGNVAPVSSAGSALFALRGPINAGVRSLPVSFTSSAIPANDGWNLVGNPYPSTIDWDAGGWTKTNINNAIYMRDNGQVSPVYATYVAGVPTNGGTRYIPTGQAFFVKSDVGSPVLSATESVKVAGLQSTFFREETINNILRIDLSKGGIKDEIVIRFAENSTESFDPKMDAYKLKNGSATRPVLNLSSISKEKFQMAINAAGPPIKCGSVNRKSIALSVDNVSSGSHTLTFREFESFSSDVKIVLKDSFRGDSLAITPQSNQYVFDITSDVMSFGENRFTLTFSCPSIVTALNEPTIDMEVKIYPNPTEGSFEIQIPSVQGTRVSIINSIGGTVGEVLLLDDSKYQTGSFELHNQPVGVYLVKISNGNKIVTKKVVKK